MVKNTNSIELRETGKTLCNSAQEQGVISNDCQAGADTGCSAVECRPINCELGGCRNPTTDSTAVSYRLPLSKISTKIF